GVCIGFARQLNARASYVFDLKKARAALFDGQWDKDAGLYLRIPLGQRIYTGDVVSVGPISSPSENRIVGIALILRGLVFQLLFDMTGMTRPSVDEGWKRRPSIIEFDAPRRTHTVVLTWPAGTPEAEVSMTL